MPLWPSQSFLRGMTHDLLITASDYHYFKSETLLEKWSHMPSFKKACIHALRTFFLHFSLTIFTPQGVEKMNHFQTFWGQFWTLILQFFNIFETLCKCSHFETPCCWGFLCIFSSQLQTTHVTKGRNMQTIWFERGFSVVFAFLPVALLFPCLLCIIEETFLESNFYAHN